MKNILENITPDDAIVILRKLAETDPDIRDLILKEAKKIFNIVDWEEVSEEVFWELDCISVEELWDGSGANRNGYIPIEEMAYEMIEEALESFEQQIARYENMDMIEQAKYFRMGMLHGMYRFVHDSKTAFREWATDEVYQYFDTSLDTWKKKVNSDKEQEEIASFLAAYCSNWAY